MEFSCPRATGSTAAFSKAQRSRLWTLPRKRPDTSFAAKSPWGLKHRGVSSLKKFAYDQNTGSDHTYKILYVEDTVKCNSLLIIKSSTHFFHLYKMDLITYQVQNTRGSCGEHKDEWNLADSKLASLVGPHVCSEQFKLHSCLVNTRKTSGLCSWLTPVKQDVFPRTRYKFSKNYFILSASVGLRIDPAQQSL